MKWAPSLAALLLSAATIYQPAIQAWMGAHPVVMTLLGSVAVITSHLLPSPVGGGSNDPGKG